MFSPSIIARAGAMVNHSDCRTSVHVALVFPAGKRTKPLACGVNSICGSNGYQRTIHAEISAIKQYYSKVHEEPI